MKVHATMGTGKDETPRCLYDVRSMRSLKAKRHMKLTEVASEVTCQRCLRSLPKGWGFENAHVEEILREFERRQDEVA